MLIINVNPKCNGVNDMSNLFEAMNATATTENGMAAYHSSLDAHVDLFNKIGASRGRFDNILPSLSAALSTDTDLTLRILLWARDARGGAGERQLAVDGLKMAVNDGFVNDYTMAQIFGKLKELGRFDDILQFVDTKFEADALNFYASYLREGDGLAAKWAPRKGAVAAKLRNVMGLSPKQYRRLVVDNTSVVETKMCEHEWDSIEFQKVPSLAMTRYLTAFHRNAPEAFGGYRDALKKGDTKVNAGAVYPYDVVRALRYSNDDVAVKQWDSMPNYMGSAETRIMPVVDVSGSMGTPVAASVSAMDVAMSLGLYISERNNGTFKDQFITFSEAPRMVKLKGDLRQRMTQMRRHVGYNTNLELVFKTLLKAAVKARVPAEEMPNVILLLSDMQFDHCTGNPSQTAIQMIRDQYEKAGYAIPNVVFWNIADRGNVAATSHETGAALVSGFSPAIMQAIMAMDIDGFTPVNVMLKAVNIDRYKI
jgi:hypothetical protein